MQATRFNILRISAGSVLVDINAPEKAAKEIHRQSLDPNSRYKKKKRY
jgi:sRNA-binding carbon storage regulator CsrA